MLENTKKELDTIKDIVTLEATGCFTTCLILFKFAKMRPDLKINTKPFIIGLEIYDEILKANRNTNNLMQELCSFAKQGVAMNMSSGHLDSYHGRPTSTEHVTIESKYT